MGFSADEPRDDHGRWTGGGGGQAAGHANGVVSAAVLDVVRNNPNGFSVTPHGSVPTDGYMVATSGNTTTVPAKAMQSSKGQAILNKYVQEHAAALKAPGAHIGGWLSGGKVYLDVSQRVTSKSQAIKLGKARNQIAIFDVKNLKDIPTGGTGQ